MVVLNHTSTVLPLEAGSNTRHRMMLASWRPSRRLRFRLNHLTVRPEGHRIDTVRRRTEPRRHCGRTPSRLGPLLGHAYAHTVIDGPSWIACAEMALVSPCVNEP